VYLAAGVNPDQADKTWIGFDGYVAGLLKANLGFIYAYAPSLNRLFGRFFDASSVTGDRSDSDSKLALQVSERMPRTMHEERSEGSGAVDELEVKMRLYSKPFDGNTATNTAEASTGNPVN
jgi:hypothetical protein